jgi:hypothetical protein
VEGGSGAASEGTASNVRDVEEEELHDDDDDDDDDDDEDEDDDDDIDIDDIDIDDEGKIGATGPERGFKNFPLWYAERR